MSRGALAEVRRFFLLFLLDNEKIRIQEAKNLRIRIHNTGHICYCCITSMRIRMRKNEAVLRIRIHVFLGLLDPDPLVRGMDPDPGLDPSIIKQK
jgi:hypothetical protein